MSHAPIDKSASLRRLGTSKIYRCMITRPMPRTPPVSVGGVSQRRAGALGLLLCAMVEEFVYPRLISISFDR